MIAPFDPNVPQQNPPPWLYYSHPITQPKPSQVGEILGKGTAQAIHLGAEGMDNALKAGLTDKIESSLDARRQAEIHNQEAGLSEASKLIQQHGGSLNADTSDDDPYTAYDQATPGGRMNILASADKPQVPQSLQDLPRQLETISAANAAGKTTLTKMWGDMNSYLSQLRNQFPGYREFIDQTARRVTGQLPANAYLHGLVAEHNALMGAGNKELARARRMLDDGLKEGYVDPKDYARINSGLAAGKIDPTGALNEVTKLIGPGAQLKARVNDLKNNATITEDEASKTTDAYLSDKARSTVAVYAGSGFMSPTDIAKMAVTKHSPEQQQLMEQSIAANIHEYETNAQAYGDTKTADGKTIREKAGGSEKFNALVSRNREYLEHIQKMVNAGDMSSANRDARFIEGTINSNVVDAVQKQPILGQLMAAPKIFGAQSQEALKALFESIATNPKIPDAVKGWVAGVGAMSANPNPPMDPKTGKPPSLEQHSQDIPPGFSGAQNQLVKYVEDAGSSTIPDENAVARFRWAFDPQHAVTLEKYGADYDVNGQRRSGRYRMFDRFTSGNIPARVAQLGQTAPGAADLPEAYHSWLQREFLKLYVPDIHNLDTVRLNIRGGPKTPPAMIGWNDKTNNIELKAPDLTNPVYDPIKSQVGKLNYALTSFVRAETAIGKDPRVELAKIMHMSGFTPTPEETKPARERVGEGFQALGQGVLNAGSVIMNGLRNALPSATAPGESPE